MQYVKNKNDKFLHPDNALMTQLNNGRITTVLGSCIAITMYCEHDRAGAICHASLPICPDLKLNLNINSPLVFKYVDSSIYKMIEWFESKNIDIRKLEVKMFGGANYLLRAAGDKRIFNVGKNNIETARKILKEFRLNLKSTDIGGSDGRKIIFDVSDGVVLLKRIPH
ncbi:MAG: chemotaxis protein CheD [Melioribacteraceae bacterium]|nr:chemotaxis protein CheD [Melioribacteraceae bacterium]